MPCTSSMFRTLDAELQRRLTFTYTIERLFDGSGTATFLLVFLRNDSPARLNNIRGTIEPASGAVFDTMSFRLRSLGPRQQVEITRIQARVPANDLLVPVATVTVSSDVELSLRFSATGKSLTCGGRPAEAEIATTRHGAPRRQPVKFAPTGIPLSPMR